jgi:peptide/nickel transport system substrate-binding protein
MQFLINTRKPPTDNLAFRQALTHIWDYATVADTIYAGTAVPAAGPIPLNMWGHDPTIETPAFDLGLARNLIAQSGVPAGERHVTMAYIGTDEEYKNAALLFQQNAAKVGITVDLLPGPWGAIWDKAKNLDTAPNLQSMTWWPTYATPADWLIGLFRTENRTLFNLSHYSNAEFDRTVGEGAELEASNRAAATAKYGAAQHILMKDAPAIFAADLRTRVAYRADIAGLEANPAYSAVFFYRIHREAPGG